MKRGILLLSAIFVLCIHSCKDPLPEIELDDFMYITLTGAKSNPLIKKLDLANTRDTLFNVAVSYGGTTNYNRGTIEATIDADFTLVDAFNTENLTNYLPMPAAAFSLSSTTARIEDGRNSSDPLKLTVRINSLNLSNQYLLPLTVKSISGGGLPLNEELKTLYLVFEADIDEEIGMSRWVSGGASSAQNPVTNAFDGSENTYWQSNESGALPQWFIVDMAGYKRIDGFTLKNRKDIGQDATPKRIKFETSLNKTDWQTVLEVDELPQSRLGQVLPIEETVIARYIRVTVLSTWNNAPYTYLAELSIYTGEDPEPEQDIEKHKWTPHGASSVWQAGYEVTNTFDDNINSYWHSDLTGLPQWYSIDMQKEFKVSGFTFVNRQDRDQYANPKAIKIEVSLDGTSWSTALTMDEVPQIYELQVFPLDTPVKARYFKITVESNWSGNTWTYVAELAIY